MSNTSSPRDRSIRGGEIFGLQGRWRSPDHGPLSALTGKRFFHNSWQGGATHHLIADRRIQRPFRLRHSLRTNRGSCRPFGRRNAGTALSRPISARAKSARARLHRVRLRPGRRPRASRDMTREPSPRTGSRPLVERACQRGRGGQRRNRHPHRDHGQANVRGPPIHATAGQSRITRPAVPPGKPRPHPPRPRAEQGPGHRRRPGHGQPP